MTNIIDSLETLFKILGQIVFIIILLIIGYQLVKAIIGGTWETENIIIGILGIIMSGVFVIVGFLIHQGRSIGVLEERTKNMGEGLSRLGNDFREHVNEFKEHLKLHEK